MTAHRVLLADRDPELLASYKRFLTRAGFRVATASTGLDCVGQLRDFEPEVLVLDPELPWGRGEGVLALMHEEPDVPLVPVILLADDYEGDNLYPVGVFPVSTYHVKPLAPAALAESLRRLLRRQAQRERVRRKSGCV